MENPIKIDDLGVPLFLETPILNTKNMQDLMISGITSIPPSGDQLDEMPQESLNDCGKSSELPVVPI